MNKGDNVIVSIRVCATIRDVNLDGTFNVYVTKIGGTALKPEIVVRRLVMSQLESKGVQFE